MNTELLEKMQYLHECGFEPDKWWNTGVISDTTTDFRGLGLSEDNDSPYFTESCLWSLFKNSGWIFKRFNLQTDNLLEHLLDNVIALVKQGYLVQPSKTEV